MTLLVLSEAVFEGASGEACPAVGIGYKILLTFHDPVSTLAVSFRLSH